MVLTYDRMLQLFIVANAIQPISSTINVRKQDLTIKFSEYVKGQVHLNFITGLNALGIHRSIYDYQKALHFIRDGQKKYYESTLKVLSYFYEDMCNFLIKNREEVNVTLDVDVELNLPVKHVSLSEVRYDLMKIIKCSYLSAVAEPKMELFSGEWATVDVSDCDLYTLLQECKYTSLFSECNNTVAQLESMVTNINNYTVAAILHECVKDENIQLIQMEE